MAKTPAVVAPIAPSADPVPAPAPTPKKPLGFTPAIDALQQGTAMIAAANALQSAVPSIPQAQRTAIYAAKKELYANGTAIILKALRP